MQSVCSYSSTSGCIGKIPLAKGFIFLYSIFMNCKATKQYRSNITRFKVMYRQIVYLDLKFIRSAASVIKDFNERFKN